MMSTLVAVFDIGRYSLTGMVGYGAGVVVFIVMVMVVLGEWPGAERSDDDAD